MVISCEVNTDCVQRMYIKSDFVSKPMKIFHGLQLMTVLALVEFQGVDTGEAKGGDRPNIVFIVADDVGWNDVGWNNPSMITPYMNKLARKGVILDNLYVMPLCSPSRASFMTGYYPYHLGLQNSVIKQDFPKYVPTNVTLLSEKLKTLGYRTHAIGKWDLGNCNVKYTPTKRAFDDFMGTYNGFIDHYTKYISESSDFGGAYDFRLNLMVYRPQEEYSTFQFARRAVDIISTNNHSNPLFLYIPFVAPHIPLQVPKEFSNLYSCVNDRSRRVYSGMVTAIDVAVNRIVNALKKHKLMENTLIFFMSDNGGDTTLGGANNLPFRGEKGELWEGGTKSASFVYSRNLLKKKGYRNSGIMHAVDIFPTFVSLAGGTVDDNIDGMSQWPMLSGDAESVRDEFVYNINEINGVAAIRVRDLKLMEGIQYSNWYQLPENTCNNQSYGNFKNRIYRREISNQEDNINNINSKFQIDSCKIDGVKKSYRLFNITRDPEERFDIACRQPDTLDYMIRKLEHYKKSLVRAQEDTNDPPLRSSIIHGVISHNWC